MAGRSVQRDPHGVAGAVRGHSSLRASAAEVTVRPPTAVTTPPGSMPARSAGEPATTPATRDAVDVARAAGSQTWTPKNAVAPMWTVSEELPAMICCAIGRAWSIGMAKPSTSRHRHWCSSATDPAVTMPTTLPSASTSAPPESPGWMAARLDQTGEPLLEPSRLVLRGDGWSSAVTVPATALGVPPTPPALPTATTASPTLTLDELPNGATVSPDAPWSRMTATSCVLS